MGNFKGCVDPDPIPHGFPSAENVTYGQGVMYACENGYRIVGADVTLLCMADGTWFGNKPYCITDIHVSVKLMIVVTSTLAFLALILLPIDYFFQRRLRAKHHEYVESREQPKRPRRPLAFYIQQEAIAAIVHTPLPPRLAPNGADQSRMTPHVDVDAEEDAHVEFDERKISKKTNRTDSTEELLDPEMKTRNTSVHLFDKFKPKRVAPVKEVVETRGPSRSSSSGFGDNICDNMSSESEDEIGRLTTHTEDDAQPTFASDDAYQLLPMASEGAQDKSVDEDTTTKGSPSHAYRALPV